MIFINKDIEGTLCFDIFRSSLTDSESIDKGLKSGDVDICNEINQLVIYNLKKKHLNIISKSGSEKDELALKIKEIVEKSKYCVNWFSNMRELDEPFSYQGILFRTTEHFYQAMKFPKENSKIRLEISKKNPHAAKVFARKYAEIPEDWESKKIDIMSYALNIKFAQGTSWREKLNNCEDEVIEWNNWGDKFWGRSIFDNLGENNLGKMLENIKDNKND